MKEQKRVSGENATDIWQQLKNDLSEDAALLEYNVVLEQGGKKVLLHIDVDPGGGFESGYTTTTFFAPLTKATNLHLNIHKEGFLDEAGKLFGMQDVVIGYPEFDKKVIIKTNDEAKVKQLFSSESVRTTIGQLDDYTLKIKHGEDGEAHTTNLELIIENEVPQWDALKKIYEAFYQLLVNMAEQ
jgi:hypothetical protein